MSPTAASNVAATITLTPGTVISRCTSGQSSACSAITRDLGELTVQERDVTHAGVDGLALLDRQFEPRQPVAA